MLKRERHQRWDDRMGESHGDFSQAFFCIFNWQVLGLFCGVCVAAAGFGCVVTGLLYLIFWSLGWT